MVLFPNLHVSAQQLDLQRHDGLADPDHGEDAGEDDILLVALGAVAEEHAEHEAEDEGAPHVPVAQAGGHVVLVEEGLGVDEAAGQALELLAGAVEAGAAQVGVGAADALGRLEHGAAEQVLGVQHLAHLGPHGQQVAPQRLPDRLVDGVLRRPPVLARDPRGQVALVQAVRRRGGADVAREGLALRERVVKVIEIGWGEWRESASRSSENICRSFHHGDLGSSPSSGSMRSSSISG